MKHWSRIEKALQYLPIDTFGRKEKKRTLEIDAIYILKCARDGQKIEYNIWFNSLWIYRSIEAHVIHNPIKHQRIWNHTQFREHGIPSWNFEPTDLSPLTTHRMRFQDITEFRLNQTTFVDWTWYFQLTKIPNLILVYGPHFNSFKLEVGLNDWKKKNLIRFETKHVHDMKYQYFAKIKSKGGYNQYELNWIKWNSLNLMHEQKSLMISTNFLTPVQLQNLFRNQYIYNS